MATTQEKIVADLVAALEVLPLAADRHARVAVAVVAFVDVTNGSQGLCIELNAEGVRVSRLGALEDDGLIFALDTKSAPGSVDWMATVVSETRRLLVVG